jgi:histidinol-phosphatase
MPSRDLALALALADTADQITLSRAGAADLRIDRKPDRTPVTDADLAVEDAIRTVLRTQRPQDAVLGEERGGAFAGLSTGIERRWLLDPIDGTKNFLRGVPVWATLIALTDGDDVVVAVVSAPALGRRWWAMRGAGAFAGRSLARGSRCHVSEVSRLEDASLSYSSLSGWEDVGRLDQFVGLTRQCWRTRAYGDFWSYVLVGEGVVDVACEPEVALWDLAAVSLIVEEAGGRFTTVDGEPGPGGGSGVATNGHLHDAVLAQLAKG